MSLSEAVSRVDSWFRGKCDGNWEHQAGITIETTDNPGWLMTLDDYSIDSRLLSEITDEVSRKYRAKIHSDGIPLRVFAHTLGNCLQAAAAVIDAVERPENEPQRKRRVNQRKGSKAEKPSANGER